jgi:hypothetical protein
VQQADFCAGATRARRALPHPDARTDESLRAVPRSRGPDRQWASRQHASIRPAGRGGCRTVSVQESFDADLGRAMSRRQFVARLARASSAALLVSSPLGCGRCEEGSSACVAATRLRSSTPSSRKSSPRSSTASIRPIRRSGGDSSRRIRTTTRSPPTRSSPGPTATSSWAT